MTQTTTIHEVTIGIDLGDRQSHVCVLNEDGEIVEAGTVPTTQAGMRRRFERCEPTSIAIEAGGQSAWVAELLEELGHEVLVAKARRLRLVYANDKKCDEVDAELLARVARLDPKLLSPIKHRDRGVRADLAKARARDELVSARTALINHTRTPAYGAPPTRSGARSGRSVTNAWPSRTRTSCASTAPGSSGLPSPWTRPAQPKNTAVPASRSATCTSPRSPTEFSAELPHATVQPPLRGRAGRQLSGLADGNSSMRPGPYAP